MTPMQQKHGIFVRLYRSPVALRLIHDSLPICLLACLGPYSESCLTMDPHNRLIAPTPGSTRRQIIMSRRRALFMLSAYPWR